MTQGVRTTVTLAALALLLVLAGLWGWQATTTPLPAKVDTPVCVATEVAAGEKVFPEQVTVSVWNGGQRAGLAGRTMQLLTDAGFAEGHDGNVSGSKVSVVAIWTQDPDSPAVALVASRLGKDVPIVQRDGPGPGVNVIVGDGFQDLVKGRRSVVAGQDASICSPPVE
jgi:hypothetical protein